MSVKRPPLRLVTNNSTTTQDAHEHPIIADLVAENKHLHLVVEYLKEELQQNRDQLARAILN